MKPDPTGERRRFYRSMYAAIAAGKLRPIADPSAPIGGKPKRRTWWARVVAWNVRWPRVDGG